MNKKLLKSLAVASSISISTLSLASCKHYDLTLVVYNWEDYIAEGADELGDIVDDSALELFQDYYYETYEKTVYIDYETFSTPEDMYNQIRCGAISPDLICPSDYMIQKMQREGMLEAFDYDVNTKSYGEKMANLEKYCSPYIKNLFEENEFSSYAVPYFWGTMGYIYDPEYVAEEDAASWDLQYNEAYKGKIAIKDSIRDTYATAILHVYKDEVTKIHEKYENGECSSVEFNEKLTEIFNRCDDTTLQMVETELIGLKKNIYGLELDDGKNEMVKGTYWINVAWSGDAVYALDQAEALGKYLNYSIPKEGSNVWFDGWCMPKGANTDLAQEFVNFLCKPEIAAMNMDYTGYTTPIVGPEIWDLVLEYYQCDEGVESDEVDLSFYFGSSIDQDAIIFIDKEERGRQFDAQYPDEDTLKRCCIMRDFGDQTQALNQMWTNFKAHL